jgi:hypothetical protein
MAQNAYKSPGFRHKIASKHTRKLAHEIAMSAVIPARDSDKTHIYVMEGRHMFDASRSILASSNDAFLEFLAKKLESIKANDDAQARTVMVQEDRWLSATFARYHREATGFCTNDKMPLYVTRASQYKRVECDVCQDFFSCSRNFKGRHLLCVPCEEKTANSKRKLEDADAQVPASKRVASVGIQATSDHGSESSTEEEDAV